jgi:hypothetical protein
MNVRRFETCCSQYKHVTRIGKRVRVITFDSSKPAAGNYSRVHSAYMNPSIKMGFYSTMRGLVAFHME